MSGLPSSQTSPWVSMLTMLWNHSCLKCNNCTWNSLIKNSFHHIFFLIFPIPPLRNVRCSVYWKSLTYYKTRWENFSDECPKCAKSHISASCYFIPNVLFTGCFMWEWLCLLTLPVSQLHYSTDSAPLESMTPRQLIIATLVMKAFLGKAPQLWHKAWYGSVIWLTVEEKVPNPEALTHKPLQSAQSQPWGNSSAVPVCSILTRRTLMCVNSWSVLKGWNKSSLHHIWPL